MKVTELFSCSAYHVYLHLALKDAVDEYNRLAKEAKDQPPVTEETATWDLTKLHYSCEQSRIIVILLTAACVEALANLYLVMKATAEQFQVVEEATFIEKWAVLPSLFLKGYSFPKDGVLYQDLKRLQDRRNAILHLKERVSLQGELVHKGQLPKWAGDEEAFIGRCSSLPMRLVAHVATFDKDFMVPTLGFSFPPIHNELSKA